MNNTHIGEHQKPSPDPNLFNRVTPPQLCTWLQRHGPQVLLLLYNEGVFSQPTVSGHSPVNDSLVRPSLRPDQGGTHWSLPEQRMEPEVGVVAAGLGPGLASLSVQTRTSARHTAFLTLNSCEGHPSWQQTQSSPTPTCTPLASLCLRVTVCGGKDNK